MSLKVDFGHRTSKPTTPAKGIFYWVQNSTGSQIWFAPSDDPKELMLIVQTDLIYEPKLTWKVIK